uniref:Metalloproteinase inhibitor 3-like n=1 Tax=Crassostrea virginica TaxID=6565 RepID=A0A8B8BAM8_CRAVI|nr:metalloproteinase inhibitor 3-like [Crassostrea virginica]
MKSTLLFLCVVSVVVITEACKCFLSHPQTNFCRSDYVIKARILGESNVDNFRKKYKVQVLVNYKSGYTRPFRDSVIWISTATQSAACGVTFDIGNTYVITGSISNGEFNTHTCTWNSKVTDLTSFQRNALQNGIYRDNCNCKIRSCPHNVCEQGEGCLAPYATSSCYDEQAACTRSLGTCQWTQNSC